MLSPLDGIWGKRVGQPRTYQKKCDQETGVHHSQSRGGVEQDAACVSDRPFSDAVGGVIYT